MKLKDKLAEAKKEMEIKTREERKIRVREEIDKQFEIILDTPCLIALGEAEITLSDYNNDVDLATAYLIELGFTTVSYRTKKLVVTW
jgi:hypothetical protein